MQPRKPVLYLFVLLLVFSVFVAPTSAQDENDPASCSYYTLDGEVAFLATLSFEDCAIALFYQMAGDGLSEAYGYWGQAVVAVNDIGEVYYAEDAPEPEWLFWGELNLEGLAASQDNLTGTQTIDETVGLALMDIDTFWGQLFAEQELEYSSPYTLFFEEASVSSPCGDMSADRGPFYCGVDNTMYLPVGFMIDQYNRIGDFALVTVIAHEWGHSVQMQLGLMDTQMSIDMELQADCLAGSYAGYVATESELAELSSGDINESLKSLFEVGDSEQTPWFDPQAHGTSDERQEAFLAGYEGGVEVCFG